MKISPALQIQIIHFNNLFNKLDESQQAAMKNWHTVVNEDVILAIEHLPETFESSDLASVECVSETTASMDIVLETILRMALDAFDGHETHFIKEKSVLLHDLGLVCKRQGKFAEAQALLSQALALTSENDFAGAAKTHYSLGQVYHLQGDDAQSAAEYATARKCFQEPYCLTASMSEQLAMAKALYYQGKDARQVNDLLSAEKFFKEVLFLYRQATNPLKLDDEVRYDQAKAHNELALTYLAKKDFGCAHLHFSHSLHVLNTLPDKAVDIAVIQGSMQVLGDSQSDSRVPSAGSETSGMSATSTKLLFGNKPKAKSQVKIFQATKNPLLVSLLPKDNALVNVVS